MVSEGGVIETRGADGRVNGWLLPIWNALENPELRPEQVYLTAVAAWERKGPHLHMKRRGCFVCVSGNVRIVMQSTETDERREEITGEDWDYRRVIVPPGWAAAIYNVSDSEALVLNLPSPAWSKGDPDEWPVENWRD